MAKNAVYRPMAPYYYKGNSELKRLSILFEKIYIPKPITAVLRPPEPIDRSHPQYETVSAINEELKLYEHLQECGIIEEYKQIPLLQNSSISEPEKRYVNEYLEQLKKYGSNSKPIQSDLKEVEEQVLRTFTIEDIHARIDSLEMSRISKKEFYPILRTNTSFVESGKKSEVMQFILNKIPAPDENTSWEKIIEFKKDNDVMKKYYALIHWVNTVAVSSASLSDIEDHYNTLHAEYMQAFKLTKMIYRNQAIKIIVTVGDHVSSSLLKGKILSAIHGLFDIRAAKLTLLEQENKLPGNVIAYIDHVNNAFRS